MTIDEVRAAVAAIERSSDDDESAHVMEDKLYRRILTAIMDGADNAPALAREALRTQDIHFSRWCA